VELDPNLVDAHRMLASEYAFRGKWDDALREGETMLDLDPLSVRTAGSVGTLYLYAKQYDKAIQHLDEAVELDPKNSFWLGNLGLAHIQIGMLEVGLEEVKRAAETSGRPSADLAYAYVKAGKTDEARKLLAKLLQSSDAGRTHSVVIGGIYASLGEKQKAMDWLERAYDEQSGYLSAVGHDFVFEGLQDDPRFQSLLKKMNLG
jgi:tetratricopeptide (TPR) repeat protein